MNISLQHHFFSCFLYRFIHFTSLFLIVLFSFMSSSAYAFDVKNSCDVNARTVLNEHGVWLDQNIDNMLSSSQFITLDPACVSRVRLLNNDPAVLMQMCGTFLSIPQPGSLSATDIKSRWTNAKIRCSDTSLFCRNNVGDVKKSNSRGMYLCLYNMIEQSTRACDLTKIFIKESILSRSGSGLGIAGFAEEAGEAAKNYCRSITSNAVISGNFAVDIADGGACSTNSQCASNRCENDGVCRTRNTNGSLCTRDRQCLSGRCKLGSCKACTRNRQCGDLSCVSGACR